MAGVITASEPTWIAPFSGPSARQFRKLVTALRREGADEIRRDRPWGLPFEPAAYDGRPGSAGPGGQPRPVSRGDQPAGAVSRRTVVAIVAEPSTRVPS